MEILVEHIQRLKNFFTNQSGVGACHDIIINYTRKGIIETINGIIERIRQRVMFHTLKPQGIEEI